MANYPPGSAKVLAAGSGRRGPRWRGSLVPGMQAAARPPQLCFSRGFAPNAAFLPANLCPGVCSVAGCGGSDMEMAFCMPELALTSGPACFCCLL